jgi:8-oxo-dGTP diphosphatase
VQLKSDSDASDARWWPVTDLPRLAFDHAEIVRYGVQRLRTKLPWDNIGSQLLPPRFTMADLQMVYETVLGSTLQRPLDKRNFQRRMLESGAIRETGDTLVSGKRGPQPRLYEFVPAPASVVAIGAAGPWEPGLVTGE